MEQSHAPPDHHGTFLSFSCVNTQVVPTEEHQVMQTQLETY